MESSAETGRVTRALRKRLTSIDSNQSNSRPGTPLQKLSAVPETDSPRSLRKTRRASISTPIATPSKNKRSSLARAETPELGNTPARRTRLRSISITQDDEVENIKPSIKNKIFAAVDEEDDNKTDTSETTQSEEKGKKKNVAKRGVSAKKVEASEQKKMEIVAIKEEPNTSIEAEEIQLKSPNHQLENNISVNEKQDIKISPTTLSDKTKSKLQETPERIDIKRVTRSQSKSPLDNLKTKANDTTGELVIDQNTEGKEEKNENYFQRVTRSLSKSPEQKPKKQFKEESQAIINADSHDDTSKTPQVSLKQMRQSLDNVNDSKTMPSEECEKTNIKAFDTIYVGSDVDLTGKDKRNEESNTKISNNSNALTVLSQNPLKTGDNEEKERVESAKEDPENSVETEKVNIESDMSQPKAVQNNISQSELSNNKHSPTIATNSVEIIIVSTNESTIHNEQTKLNENKSATFENILPVMPKEDKETPQKNDFNVVANCVTDKETSNELIAVDTKDQTKSKITEVLNEPITEDAKVVEIIALPSITPQIMVRLTTEDSDHTPEKKNESAEKSKNVAFSEIDGNSAHKTVYPKTPAQTKSRSYINMLNSPSEGDDSFESAVESVEKQPADTQPSQLIYGDKHKSVDDETGQKQYKPLSYSSTPVGSDPVIKAKQESATPQNILKENDSLSQISFIKSWQKSVRGSANSGDKIDSITVEQSEPETDKKQISPEKSNKKLKFRQSLPLRFSSDEENEKSDTELDDKEELIKNEYVDDEAMEVDDYESGDSLDSEERKEIEENEILDYGEAIDLDEDEDDDDEDEDNDDAESEYERDSFVCSDSDELGELQYSCESDEQLEDNEIKTKSKKVKVKRKRIIENSSENDEDSDVQDEKVELEKNSMKEQSNKNENKKTSHDSANSSKLSESALMLHQSDKEDQQSPEDEAAKQKLNASRIEILRDMNKSDRFNKTVHELDVDPTEESPEKKSNLLNGNDDKQSDEQINESDENEDINSEGEHEDNVMSQSLFVLPADVAESSSEENSNEQATKTTKLEPKLKNKLHGLSVSLSHIEEKKSHLGKVFHKSFCLNVSISKDKKEQSNPISQLALPNTVRDSIENKSDDDIGDNDKEDVAPFTVMDNHESELNDSETDEIKDADESVHLIDNEEKLQLEKLSHLQTLFNPLQKSKRQSLYTPSEKENLKAKTKFGKPRYSNDFVNSNDFNPSQSFIEILAERQREEQRMKSKRKRLSKSFCGVSDSLDVTQEIEHLHKKSKICEQEDKLEREEYSDEEVLLEESKEEREKSLSIEAEYLDDEDVNDNEEVAARDSSYKFKKDETDMNKPVNKDVAHYERVKAHCDAILEAANKAKLEQKTMHNKLKRKKLKKQPKILDSPTSTGTTLPLKKQLKRLDSRKKGAIKEAECVEIKQKQQKSAKGKEKQVAKQKHAANSLSWSASGSSSATSPNSSDQENLRKNRQKRNLINKVKTSTGYFVEGLVTPKNRKRYIEKIETVTGTMRVEPVSPVSKYFHEEPISPQPRGTFRRVKQHPAGWGGHNSSCSPKSKSLRKAISGQYKKPDTAYEAAQNFKQHALGRLNETELLQRKKRQRKY